MIDKIASLRTRLFDLINDYKTLQSEIWNIDISDNELLRDEIVSAASNVDDIACKLAQIYESMSENELVSDSFRDPADRTYKQLYSNAMGRKLNTLILKNSSSISAWCKDNGFPQSTIQEYIKGTKKPGWEMVQKLADALDVSTEDLRG